MTDWVTFVYFTLLGICMLLLCAEPRFSARRVAGIFCVYIPLLFAVNIWLLQLIGKDWFWALYPFTVRLPTVLLVAYIGQARGWRLLFQLLSSVLFCYLIQHASMLVFLWSGGRVWALLLAYIVLTALILFFLLRYLRPLYFEALHKMDGVWWLLCLILAVYTVSVQYLIPGFMGENRLSTVAKPLLSLIMAGGYCVILTLFSSVRRASESEFNNALFAAQLVTLQNRLSDARTVEENIRIQRHDLRHRFNTIAALVKRGDTEAALEYIDAACVQLEESRPERWCSDPILDATFSVYFAQARQQGTRIEARIALPETLPTDATELSVVLANALENAIHACRLCPEDQRVIHCKCIGSPQLMLEIANPCVKEVRLGADGFPVTSVPGHGTGLRSVRTFCIKHGAAARCTYKNGWFLLRITF